MRYYACGAAMAGMVAVAATAVSWAQTATSGKTQARAATPAAPASGAPPSASAAAAPAAPSQPTATSPAKPQKLASSPTCSPAPRAPARRVSPIASIRRSGRKRILRTTAAIAASAAPSLSRHPHRLSTTRRHPSSRCGTGPDRSHGLAVRGITGGTRRGGNAAAALAGTTLLRRGSLGRAMMRGTGRLPCRRSPSARL